VKLNCCNGELKSDIDEDLTLEDFSSQQASTVITKHGLLALDCGELKYGDGNYALMSEEYLRPRKIAAEGYQKLVIL